MLDVERIEALHRAYPPIDLHVDTLMWARHFGYDMSRRHEPPLPRAAWGGHMDVPRMREGRVGGAFLGLVALPIVHRNPYRVVCEQIDALDGLVEREPGVRKVREPSEFDACAREGAIGFALGLEGAHALMGDVDKMRVLASRGVRYLGLTHFSSNEAANPAYGIGQREQQGLTKFGFELVEICEELGVMVDLAHLNRKGFEQVCEIARRPLLVSHTGISSVFEHWRNIDEAQVRAVAERGGVIGVMVAPRFLGRGGLAAVVAHMLEVIRIGGEDSVAIGSDWDGMVVPARQLRDVSCMGALTMALLEAGLREEQVGKVLRGNVLRVWEGQKRVCWGN